MTIRKLIHIGLAILLPYELCACATPAAIKYAEELASKPTIHRKIINIYPLAFREDENVELCVTLSCPSGTCKEENYVVVIPVASLHSGKTTPEKIHLVADRLSNDPYFPIYWFPMKNPSANCAETAAKKESTCETIYLKDLYIYTDKWEYLIDAPRSEDEVYSIFAYHNENMFAGGDVQILKTVKPDDLTVEDMVLIYLPDRENGAAANPMCLIGGYDDPSTQAGYVLIPFALAVDAALLAAAAIVVLAGLFAGAYDSAR